MFLLEKSQTAFNNLLLNIKHRAASQASTIPRLMSRFPAPVKMSPTVPNSLITTILSCHHFFYPHLHFCCYIKSALHCKICWRCKITKVSPDLAGFQKARAPKGVNGTHTTASVPKGSKSEHALLKPESGGEHELKKRQE